MSELDEVELRFFTLRLGTDREPSDCARCHKERVPLGCVCTAEELRAWIAEQPAEPKPIRRQHVCSRVRAIRRRM